VSIIIHCQGWPYAWCATAVDNNGVMLPNSVGNCDDERNVAYDGPGMQRNKVKYFLKIIIVFKLNLTILFRQRFI